MNGFAVSSDSSRSGSRSSCAANDRRALLEHLLRLLGGGEDGGAVLLHPRLLRQARDRLLEGLQVGEDQLGVDRLDVVGRVDAAVDVDDVLVVERADDLADRVGLADVREELVAQALALGRALDDAGDVDERHGRREDLLRAEDLGEHVQPRVRDPDDADVGLDRRERVVRREHVVLGQRVEQRGLADVGEADDPDGEAHGPRV